MGTLAQTVLPFKLEATEEELTANAGLVLFGEFVHGLGFSRWLGQEMPKPGSGRGYEAQAYVTPLDLMLTGGGRSLEDLRTLKNDRALATLLKQDTLPSTDATGDWLRRTGAGEGLVGLDRINRRVSRCALSRLRALGRDHRTHPGWRCQSDRCRERSRPIHLQGRARLHAHARPPGRSRRGHP